MASTNQSPQYQKAEANFLVSKSDDDKIYWLDEMIKLCPRHKSAEKMLANLKTRRKKLLEKMERVKKTSSSGSRRGIKKEEMQAAIVGFTNTGKSSLLAQLTKAAPEIASYDFTTKQPVIGMMPFSGTNIQLIEIPAFESEYYDRGLVNTADLILILVSDLTQIEKMLPELNRTRGKKMIIFNVKSVLGKEQDKRKLEATLKSKKYNFSIVNLKTKESENIEKLKEKIFQNFDKIRVYTKEPGKEKSNRPMILSLGAVIQDVARKTIKNLDQIKETKLWGPSSKFPGQVIGLQHVLKDLDVVEFKTR